MDKKVVKKKVCLLGNAAVGKTSLINKYVHNVFDDEYISTMGTKISSKDVKLLYPESGAPEVEVTCTLSIWDIIGQIEYRNLIDRYFIGADGGLFVCDVTRPETLHDVQKWMTLLFNKTGRIPVIIMANKSDLTDQTMLTTQDLDRWALFYQTVFHFTSAKDGAHVEDSFTELCERMVGASMTFEQISSPAEVADAVIMEFCGRHGGLERGMPIVQHQFKRAGVDFNSPTKAQLERACEYLVEITRKFQGDLVATQERTTLQKILAKLPA
jgi:small GTP-binding protein